MRSARQCRRRPPIESSSCGAGRRHPRAAAKTATRGDASFLPGAVSFPAESLRAKVILAPAPGSGPAAGEIDLVREASPASRRSGLLPPAMPKPTCGAIGHSCLSMICSSVATAPLSRPARWSDRRVNEADADLAAVAIGRSKPGRRRRAAPASAACRRYSPPSLAPPVMQAAACCAPGSTPFRPPGPISRFNDPARRGPDRPVRARVRCSGGGGEERKIGPADLGGSP